MGILKLKNSRYEIAIVMTNTTKSPWLRITKMHLDLDDFGSGIAKLP